MEITKEQKKKLNQFKCERLTARKKNRERIRSFSNTRSASLTRYLREEAWTEDKEGTAAVYLITSPKKKVVMYFTLKCGGLFRPLDEETIKKKAKKSHAVHALKEAIGSEKTEELLREAAGGMEIEDLIANLNWAKWMQTRLADDRERDRNAWINRVHHTYPAVELAQFSVNDDARKEWRELGFQQPLGAVMFWKFVVPCMCRLRKHAGCRYAYLFAADLSEDGRLVNYYDKKLQFKQTDALATTKPSYDFMCEFMCQELLDIKRRRKEFFNQFNPDTECSV